MFGIPASEYLIADRDNSSQCILGLSTNEYATSNNTFILGHAFLRSFYTVLDFETNRIGLGLHMYSRGFVEKAKSYRTYVIILIIVVILLGILAMFLGQKLYKQRQLKRKAETEEFIKRSNTLCSAAINELENFQERRSMVANAGDD